MTVECVVIHGLWHVPAHYQKLVQALEESRLPPHCPQLPTANNAIPPNKTFLDDCKAIRHFVGELCDRNVKVVCIMHSYGGVVGTESLDQLGLAQRQRAGLPGGVISLIYLCSFLIPAGASLVGSLGDLPPHVQQHDNGTCTMTDPGARFYNDLAEDERQNWIEKLVVSPTAIQEALICNTAYKDIPSTYIFAENDLALPIEAQQMMVKSVQESGIKMETRTLSTGHSPFVSRPDELAALVREIIASDVS